MQTLPHTHSCFVCGESNAQGLKLRFHADGLSVHTEFVPREEHAGFRRTVHGGLIAAVLDETMVWACAVGAGRFAFCAEMNVRFLRPLQPGTATVASAKLEENKRDRIYLASSEVRDSSGAVLATASGKYMPIKPDELEGMLEELVGETDGFDFARVPGVSRGSP